ncbi:MAG: hypothetical protein IJI37_05865, partial [Opitutales bacterium]|nr:hypothetical protein [Opitutales bacterium]
MNEQKALVPYQPYHSIYPAPLDRFAEITEKYGLEAWNKLVAARNKRVRLAENDPLENGYKLDSWREIWSLLEKCSTVAVLGGNRSSKSEFGGNTIGRMMTEGRFFDPPLFRKKLVNVACMFSAERPSWTLQQPYVYRYLPPEIRSSGKSAGGDINYRKGKGFTNNMFVMPNGSQCQFWFYEQEQDLVEGQEFDFVWLDEYLKGTWLDTMNYRVAGINGRILITVTLVHGMTRAVKEIMDTCKVIKTAPVNPALFDEDVSAMQLAKNCPAGHVPVLLADDKKSAAVYFLHSENNPFLDKAAFAKKLAGAPREKVLIRAYGYCDYTATAAFPKFSEKLHVVSREFLRKTAQLQRFTVYCAADPGGGKPWVVKWYALFENGWTVCLWETPQYKAFGSWARPPEKDERN